MNVIEKAELAHDLLLVGQFARVKKDGRAKIVIKDLILDHRQRGNQLKNQMPCSTQEDGVKIQTNTRNEQENAK